MTGRGSEQILGTCTARPLRGVTMKGPVSRERFHVSRWQALCEAAVAISGAVDMIAPDGSSVVFFSDGISTYTKQTAEQVAKLFKDIQPEGLTNLNEALAWTFKDILRNVKVNPEFKALIIVITDGLASRKEMEELKQALGPCWITPTFAHEDVLQWDMNLLVFTNPLEISLPNVGSFKCTVADVCMWLQLTSGGKLVFQSATCSTFRQCTHNSSQFPSK